MPVKLFQGRVCEHRHEYNQFKEIYCILSNFYRDQTIFMITNLRSTYGEIDCLLLRPDGPVILECKSVCGKIHGIENDAFWHVITPDGKKVDLNCNVFTKSERDRWDIIDRFRKKLPLIIPGIEEKKIRNVSAWGYFEKTSVYLPDQVNIRIAKWFNVVTAENLIEQLEISKSGYTLFEKDLQSIVDDFHVEPYTIPCPDVASVNEEVPPIEIKKEIESPKEVKIEAAVEEEIMAQKPEKPKVITPPSKGSGHTTRRRAAISKEFTNFKKMWENIESNIGQTFKTREGFEFTYTIDNANLLPSLQGWDEIPLADFEMAHAFGVCDNPECYGGLFVGGKIIWTILHDDRIVT